MQLQPPTDNLYKFLAIAGLVAIIASAYSLNIQNSESYGKRLALEHEFNAILDEFHTKFGSPIAHEELGISRAQEDITTLQDTLAYSLAYADRDGVIEHINLHHRQLRKLMSSPYSDAETQAFWKTWFNISDQELKSWNTEAPQRVDQIRTEAIEFRPRYEKLLQLAREIWMIEDTFDRAAFACAAGIAIGTAMMLVGFLFWYCRVQKLQDAILKYDLAEKERNSLPSNAGGA